MLSYYPKHELIFFPLKCGTRFLEYHSPEIKLVQTFLTFHKILKTPEHDATSKTESHCSIKFAAEERPAIMQELTKQHRGKGITASSIQSIDLHLQKCKLHHFIYNIALPSGIFCYVALFTFHQETSHYQIFIFLKAYPQRCIHSIIIEPYENI